MNFANPEAFLWTAVVFLTATGLAVFGLRRSDTLLARFAAQRLLENLTKRAGRARSGVKLACLLLGILAAGLALARPQYGVEYVERKARGLDIVFALDVSRSMLATDLRPNRLQRARLAVLDLIDRLDGDRVGLVSFAGQAFLQCPPTLDMDAFRESLEAAEPGALTRGGSDLAAAIRESAEAFPAGNNVKIVILLTDGEDLAGNALAAARDAAEEGITVHTVGIGTQTGTYLRAPGADGQEDYIRDASGQPVLSRLDEDVLRRIAAETGGRFFRLGSGTLETLHRTVLAALPRSERGAEISEVPVERFQWLIGVALALLVLEMLIRRRKWTPAALVIAATVFLPSPALRAQATDPLPPDLSIPETPVDTEGEEPDRDPRILYNEGSELLASGEFESARQRLNEALMRTDDLGLQRDALFNLGHALNQLADAALAADPPSALELMQEAENSFAAARDIDSSDAAASAAYNQMNQRRKALEDWLKEQENQQDQQQDSQDQQQEQEERQDDENQDDENQDGDGQQENSDQQQGDQEDQSSEKSDSSEQSGEDAGEQSQDESTESDGDDPQNGQEEDPSDSQENPGQTGDGETDDNPEQAEGSSAVMEAEGMSEEEAQQLLDTLRGSERLLPIGQPTDLPPGASDRHKDW